MKTSPYDSAEMLNTPAAIKFYMDEALETGDPQLIIYALGIVARAKSMSNIARKSGLARESLYKALSQQGSPEFSTVMRVLDALDLKLAVRLKKAKPKRVVKKKRTIKKAA